MNAFGGGIKSLTDRFDGTPGQTALLPAEPRRSSPEFGYSSRVNAACESALNRKCIEAISKHGLEQESPTADCETRRSFDWETRSSQRRAEVLRPEVLAFLPVCATGVIADAD